MLVGAGGNFGPEHAMPLEGRRLCLRVRWRGQPQAGEQDHRPGCRRHRPAHVAVMHVVTPQKQVPRCPECKGPGCKVPASASAVPGCGATVQFQDARSPPHPTARGAREESRTAPSHRTSAPHLVALAPLHSHPGTLHPGHPGTAFNVRSAEPAASRR